MARAFPQENGSVLVHLHNVSGGVLSGDDLALRIDVAAGASAQVTTTGATRLYRHRAGAEDSRQTSEFTVGENGTLEFLPDPIIPFAGSRHWQKTRIHIHRGASLFWWETVAPGRQASGEEFAFERLGMETRVIAGAGPGNRLPLLHENLLLEPKLRPLNTLARLQQYRWTASFLVCQVGRHAEFWRGLENELNQLAMERSRIGEVIWGASTLVAHGVVVRGLSINGRHLQHTLTDFWRAARRAVTGAEAVPPRKVY